MRSPSGSFRFPSSASGSFRFEELPVVPGTLLGTAIVGAMDHFVEKHGRAAGHAMIDLLSPSARMWVHPHAPSLGFLGARRYPYAVVGELVRAIAKVTKATSEDAVHRELATAGLDASLGTVARAVLRLLVTPRLFCERAQEAWDAFHDSGVMLSEYGPHDFTSSITEWPNHDPTVCKLSTMSAGLLFERMGLPDVSVTRLECQTWGHPRCTMRVRWA